MLERMQESAEKKKRLANRLAEESSDDDEKRLRPLPNQKLLLQQLQYDNEMEDEQTVND